MKILVENVLLVVMTVAMSSLTVYGALGVDPQVLQQQTLEARN
jgi:hypothetical protein